MITVTVKVVLVWDMVCVVVAMIQSMAKKILLELMLSMMLVVTLLGQIIHCLYILEVRQRIECIPPYFVENFLQIMITVLTSHALRDKSVLTILTVSIVSEYLLLLQ